MSLTDQNHQFLQLLQLSDSALPIGVAAHSFGIEALVAEGLLTVENLEQFLRDYLEEAGVVDATFCRASHSLGAATRDEFDQAHWMRLNEHLSAIRPARESRVASVTLGRRFMALAASLTHDPLLERLRHTEMHYATAFGITGRALGLDASPTLLAFLQTSVASIVSACQRLMPLGQSEAARMLWDIKPRILETLSRSDCSVDDVACALQLPELASMRHPTLATRLFIS
jgi:urease accessory protein